jgi:HTH-type transcriptional regulator/antitoxin HigA
MIDYDKLDLNKDIEKEADDFAQNIIIKKEKYDEFVNLMNYSKLSIILFSKENNIHPAILLGRLQHDKIIGWNCYNELKPRYKWTESL